MPFIPVPGVVQLESVYSMAGQTVENVFHYQTPGPIAAEEMMELALKWIDQWNTYMKPYIPTEVSLTAVKVTDLDTATSPAITASAGLPLAGTQNGVLLPNSVSLCITKRTALRGRSQRGRIYWPGLGETNVTNNVVSAALVSAIIAGLENMKVVPTLTGNNEMVVVSRFTANAPRASGIFTPVTNFTSDGVVDSQRRRLPGRGK